MNESLAKITFIGDITCDRPLLEATKIMYGGEKFERIFSQTKTFLKNSDYVVANFETVCAGSDNNYQNEFFLYNAPDEIVSAMKDGEIDFVTTANNHCLDQGIKGLKRTIDILDKNSIAHTGTFISPNDRLIEKQIVKVQGVKLAILAYTSSTNGSNTGIILNESNDYLVGLTRERVDTAIQSGGLKGIILRHLNAKQRRIIKRILSRIKLRMGISYFKPFTDKLLPSDNIENPYLVKIKNEIFEAKKMADIVAVCPHIGGQFNTVPGSYSEFLIDYLKNCGADIIAANHPHVAQKAAMTESCIAAYSLGSFNLSVSADYIVHESLPEYSMALHVYVDTNTKRIDHTAFSILKIVEDKNLLITVYPIHLLPTELMTKETIRNITTIYNRITGKNEDVIEIRDEYKL